MVQLVPGTSSTGTDRFLRYRLALAPCLGSLKPLQAVELLGQVALLDLPEFFTFLRFNRLNQHWNNFLQSVHSTGELPELFVPWLEPLHEQALQVVAQQLREREILASVHQLFEANNIPYFFFKGANLRHSLYQDQSLRSSADIDIFVLQENKFEAIKLLLTEDFTLDLNPKNTDHEVSLCKKGVDIDLHWQLFRPGRSRIDLNNYLFANRRKFSKDEYWGLNEEANLLVMLIHPVFTKHLASPDSMLIHMVDLHGLLAIIDVSGWQRVVEVLAESGTSTAAWSSLRVLFSYSGLASVEQKCIVLRPGALRQKYLQYWIDLDLIRRYFHRPLLIRGFFNLVLQDNVRDAINAISSLKHAKKQAREIALKIESL